MSLEAVSASRADLPTFPGASVLEQLLNGRAAALTVLLKYRPGLAFDLDAASQNFRAVDGWMERNGAELEKAMADENASVLPERVRLAFDKKTAQDFVIGGFTMAAVGLGPWVSGAVEANTSQEWARSDAQSRLRVFASIVQMEQTGYLRSLFSEGPGAVAGLGVLPVVPIIVGVVVATVMLAAVYAVYCYSVKQVELNNRLMRDLCERAQQQGDKATVAACIEATKGLQNIDPFGLQSIGKTIALGLLVFGGVWAALTYGPALLKKKSGRAA